MSNNEKLDLYALLEDIENRLAQMTEEERLLWFRTYMYIKPLTYVKEIDGTMYGVRTYFDKSTDETIREMLERITTKPN